jgi:excisionase family DNA binding protein
MENKSMPLLHPRPDAAKRLGISIRLLDNLLAERRLRSVKCGRRRLVSEQSLQDYIRKQERANGAMARTPQPENVSAL